jgi:hypothetical protein
VDNVVSAVLGVNGLANRRNLDAPFTECGSNPLVPVANSVLGEILGVEVDQAIVIEASSEAMLYAF